MAETNQYYIDKYNDYDSIIETNFRDKNNIDITSIINPIKIDNRQLASMTDNQSDTPHCSGFSVANLFEALYWKKTGKLKNLNANQIYAKAKTIDGNINTNGTAVYYAILAAAELCNVQDTMKYGNVKLSENNLVEVIKFYIHKYDFLLATFHIHNGWYTCTKSDFTIKPNTNYSGYHAVVIVGYDEMGVYIQNSWGINWGYKGFCVLPWKDFLDNISALQWVTI